MSLSNLHDWNNKNFKKTAPTSVCGSACGASEKSEEKPTACGTACGASERYEEKPTACGTACGAESK